MRGFVQHTLPSRFQKVRYYGWMSPNSRIGLDEVRWLLWLFLGFIYWLKSRTRCTPTNSSTPFRCRRCGGELQATLVTDQFGQLLYQRYPPYLEPG